MEKKEKKVEYLELIYDLMFVFMVGRCNSLIHNLQGGFISWHSVFVYIVYTLAVIQIWNYSTYYINIYGENSPRNHVFIFINMFLLYFMGSSTKMNWRIFQTRHHIAWSLILMNIALQYLIELSHNIEDDRESSVIKRVMRILVLEAFLIGCAASLPGFGGIILGGVAVLLGIIANSVNGKGAMLPVDFMHLSERAMLLVVFTFGEMIIAVAGYFDEAATISNFYFALMVFLIIVGLFLSYEVLYDHIIDREMQTGGLSYMMMHIIMIFGLNSISAALQFMPEDEVDLMSKLILLILAFLVYYGCLFATRQYAKPICRHDKNLYLPAIPVTAAFVAFMLLLRDQMRMNILVTVIYVYLVFITLHRYAKSLDKKCECHTDLDMGIRTYPISIAILSGGESSRMGMPKACLKIQGVTFAEYIAKKLSRWDEIMFSVRDVDDYPDIPIRHIPDIYPGCGPLAGIHSALIQSSNSLVFVVACDMPYVSQTTIDELLARYEEGADAVIPVAADGTRHSVCALYHKKLIPLLEQQLESGNYRVKDLLDICKYIEVKEETFTDYEKVFQNINTPDDYREVIQ